MSRYAAIQTMGCACDSQVEGCWLVKDDGGVVELRSSLEESDFTPTFTPSAFDRAMSARAPLASMDRCQRHMPELCFLFNLCNEPWVKYSLQAVADRGLKQWQWTSARLLSEVMYLETRRLHRCCHVMHFVAVFLCTHVLRRVRRFCHTPPSHA